MPAPFEPADEPQAELRRLLALKRNELPPPGYFIDFSARVITRIEEEQLSPSTWSAWRSWLQFLWEQPSLRGALGLITGAILIAGFGSSGWSEPSSPPIQAGLWSPPLGFQRVQAVNARVTLAPAGVVLPRNLPSSSFEPVLGDESAAFGVPVAMHLPGLGSSGDRGVY